MTGPVPQPKAATLLELFWSPRSPFVRKVVWAAAGIGALDRISLTPCLVAIGLPNPEVMRINPLNKIPVLVLHRDGEGDGGQTAVLGSRAICEWMDRELAPGRLLPLEPALRDRVQFLETLADGALDILIFLREEGVKPAGQRFAPHIEAMTLKLHATLDRFEAMAAGGLPHRVDAGALSLAACLSYMDFRFAPLDWRSGRPALAMWHTAISRNSCIADHPFVDDQIAAAT